MDSRGLTGHILRQMRKNIISYRKLTGLKWSFFMPNFKFKYSIERKEES